MLPDELFKEQAARRVLLGLVLGEVIQQQELKADPAKVREAIEELAATYESPDDVINWYYGNQEQLGTIESNVLEDQVFDYIIGQSAVTDKQVDYQEVIKPEPKAESRNLGRYRSVSVCFLRQYFISNLQGRDICHT